MFILIPEKKCQDNHACCKLYIFLSSRNKSIDLGGYICISKVTIYSELYTGVPSNQSVT